MTPFFFWQALCFSPHRSTHWISALFLHPEIFTGARSSTTSSPLQSETTTSPIKPMRSWGSVTLYAKTWPSATVPKRRCPLPS